MWNKEVWAIRCVINNCELIYFTSKSDNVGAHAFYKRLGYDMNAEKAFIKELL